MSERGMGTREIGAVLAAERVAVDDALGFAQEISPGKVRLRGAS